MIFYLGLGSNLGERKNNLHKALIYLQSIGKIEKYSSIYESEPANMPNCESTFLNMAVKFSFNSSAPKLLKEIKNIEKKMGRDLKESHNKPRVIDIDILASGENIITEKKLSIPHKKMHLRDFVLIPLKEIEPNFTHPITKNHIDEMLKDIKEEYINKKATCEKQIKLDSLHPLN